MTVFYLDKDKFEYTISVDNVNLITKRFRTEVDAIDWAKGYVSSFVRSTLYVNFVTIGDINEK